jgi:dynein heavy chain 2
LFQLQATFSVDDHGHYVFTPRDLTRWALGLLRYDIRSLGDGSFVSAWANEAHRLFRDKMSGEKDREKFDLIFHEVLATLSGGGDALVDLHGTNLIIINIIIRKII